MEKERTTISVFYHRKTALDFFHFRGADKIFHALAADCPQMGHNERKTEHTAHDERTLAGHARNPSGVRRSTNGGKGRRVPAWRCR